MASEHHGFWRLVDTIRDKTQLEELWQSGSAFWKVWRDSQVADFRAASADWQQITLESVAFQACAENLGTSVVPTSLGGCNSAKPAVHAYPWPYQECEGKTRTQNVLLTAVAPNSYLRRIMPE